MSTLAPFNIKLINPDEYIERKGCLPVTVHAMFESSTERFHPDGLFSEVIFGQMGSKDRFVRRGYIDLHTQIITPHLYVQLITLKSYYKDILAGKQYAYFDKELHDLVRTTRDDPHGDTGFSFFIQNLPNIKFTKSESPLRNDKISIMEKFKSYLLVSRYLILPAAVRDVKMKDGRPESEAINKLYLAVLSLSQAIPAGSGNDPIFDSIRYQLQNKVLEVYDYIRNIMEGKHGFSQGKYAQRDIVYGTRNVITGAPISRTPSPTSASTFKVDEIELPLFQGMKNIVPKMVHILSSVFMLHIFDAQSGRITAVNPKTLVTEYVDVDQEDLKLFTTNAGIEKLINNFRNIENNFDPISIKLKTPVKIDGELITHYYLFMVYDTGDRISTFRDLSVFAQMYSKISRYRDDNPYVHVLNEYNKNDFVIVGSSAYRAVGMKITPEDLDVVLSIPMYNEFVAKAKEDGLPPDDVGEYEFSFGDVVVHTKNKWYKIETEEAWNDFYTNNSILIGEHRYASPALLAKEAAATPPDQIRMKDKRKLEYLKEIVYDPACVRPMTWIEMFYMSCYSANIGVHYTGTRYPVVNLQGISVYKGHIMSTEPSRQVTTFTINGEPERLLPDYPKLGCTVKSSASLHPAVLGRYDADHDGDTISTIALLSDEANKEIENYLNDVSSVIDNTGNIIYGLSGGGKDVIVKFALFFCTYHQLSNSEK